MAHKKYLESSGKLRASRKYRLAQQMQELIEEKIRTHIRKKMIMDDELGSMIDKIYDRRLNPYRLAERIAREVIRPHSK
jgi:putative protein kinase ArgK-like GTPase of G3E family